MADYTILALSESHDPGQEHWLHKHLHTSNHVMHVGIGLVTEGDQSRAVTRVLHGVAAAWGPNANDNISLRSCLTGQQ